MNSWAKINKNESGQAALEAAIILIAFVVVASVFAFAVLSAGSASTARGEQAIYSGLQQVQASLELKGAVIAKGTAGSTVDHVIFTIAPVAGGDPINLADGQTLAHVTSALATDQAVVVISYLDATQRVAKLPFRVDWIVSTGADDHLLTDGELAQLTVDVTTATGGLTNALDVNTPFTLEVKPPTGAIIDINRTTPPAIAAVMQLR